ncbi:MAG: hypothetical protein ABIC04_07235 [Nanoarchaeota archaeon]
MKRKLVQHGPSTLMVSLPSKWIKMNKCMKGDEINIDEDKNILTLSPSSNFKPSKKKMDISLDSDYQKFIRHAITLAYRIGYDEINVELKNQTQFQHIKDIISRLLIGYEITEKTNNKCKIESITEPPEDKFDVLIQRILFIAVDNSKSLHDYFTLNAKPDLEYVQSQTNKADQYIYFCKRTLSKKRFSERAFFKWMLLSNLLLIHHSISRLVKAVTDRKNKPKKEFIDIFCKIDSYLNDYVKAFLRSDTAEFSDLHTLGETILYTECYNIIEKGDYGISAYHLGEVTRNIYLATIPSMGISIEFS